MNERIRIHIAFDPEAQVWFVDKSDVHSLRIEAATREELVERIPAAIQDLTSALPD